jgi:8-oxo-dGTP pyrophosphatase MutT (NUDIX family)
VAVSEHDLRERMRAHRPRPVATGPATRLASVAVVLRCAADAEVLLIRRAEHPRDPWSGHMAFPGGRQEDGDADLVDTAVRETREEVGVDLRRHAELLGRLDAIQATSQARALDLMIVPHVFLLRTRVDLAPDPGEVDEALWVPLTPMLTGAADTARPYCYQGEVMQLPGWRVGAHVVWGLTYRMLQALFQVLRDDERAGLDRA